MKTEMCVTNDLHLSDPIHAPLCVNLFGAFAATVHGAPLTGLQERQGEGLLAYLALRQGRSVSPVALAGLFWPETGSLDSLRQALTNLRRALGEEAARLETSRGGVSLDLEGAWVDVMAFDAAVTQGDLASLQKAVTLYRGHLLEDWEERWLEKEREKRRETYVQALYTVATQSGDLELTIACLRKYLRCRPSHEQAWLDLMHHLLRHGERPAALDLYHKYREYLHRHYQLPPPPAMTALYRAIREETLQSPTDLAGATGQSGATPTPLLPEETVGGAMPLYSPFYVRRSIDAGLETALARQDSLVLIQGARQTGKSSLLARGLDCARQHGAATVATNVETFGAADGQSMEGVCLRLAASLANDLDLEFSPQSDWNPLLGPNLNLERYLHRRVLAVISAPLVWGLDELDSLFGLPFSGEFFSMLRSWHEKRSFEPSRPWKRLTLVITCATEAHLYIQDLNKSPFNVGTRLTLEDFTYAQVQELHRLCGEMLGEPDVERLFRLLGGHPYLTRRGLRALVSDTLDSRDPITALEAEALEGKGPFGDHLQRVARRVGEETALRQGVEAVLAHRTPEEASFFRLRSGGVLTGTAPSSARMRCRLYEIYLRKQLHL